MIQLSVSTDPDQKFSIILNGLRVTLRLRYNPTNDRWSFDLSLDDQPVLLGRRIVTGCDLLAAYDFGIGMIFAAPIVPDANPDRANLPNGSVGLFQISEEELDAAVAS